MDYCQLPDTTIEEEGDILFIHEEGREQDIDVVDTKSKVTGQTLLDVIDNVQDEAVASGSSADEGAEAEDSGDENEGVGASGTFRGDSDAVVHDPSSRGWYRPEQRRKGRRGRGGKKNKSRKRRARGKRQENITDCAVTSDKDNKAANNTVCEQSMRAKNGSSPLDAANIAKGGICKERSTSNKSQTSHAVRGQSTRVENGPTPQAGTPADLPSVGRASSSSYSYQRPTNRRSEATDLDNSPLDVDESFHDRPRNWPRTQISRRQAAAARVRRHRNIDDYAVTFIMMTCPMSFIDFVLYSLARTRSWSDSDSD